MKITKTQLVKLIREAISLPQIPQVAPDVQLPGADEVQSDYLEDVFGGEGSATVQLTKDQIYDYSPAGNEAYMLSIGAEPVWDYEAKKITARMGAETNHPIVHKLKALLSDDYVLVADDIAEWNHYIQGNGEDPQGRGVLVVMGSDDNTVVFKARNASSRDKYFVYRG